MSIIRNNQLGLHFNRMIDFTIRFRHSAAFQYKYISKSRNCAGIAVQALVAGGGAAFAPEGGDYGKINVYINPNDAQHWSEAVQRGVDAVNRSLVELHNVTYRMDPGKSALMTYDHWRSISKVAWTIRGPETTAIDNALKEYHAADWNTSYPAKMKAFVQIIQKIRAHMLKQTKRDGAYLELANNVMGVVSSLVSESTHPWKAANYYKEDLPDSNSSMRSSSFGSNSSMRSSVSSIGSMPGSR
jgi:hypothetical protein